MHRSGTSLLCRLLEQFCVHLGNDQGPINAESRHFQRLNKRVLHAAGAAWNEPAPIISAQESPDFVAKWAQYYRAHLFAGISGMRYWGTSTWWALRCGATPPSWGWKDPRTTLTLPIWLEVFPRARIVHIIRNGIDVAISLHRRQLAQAKRWRVHPDHRDPRGFDFRFCFSLWESYMDWLLGYREIIPAGQYIELRYEELLREPQATLHSLLTELEINFDITKLAAAAATINSQRLDQQVRETPLYRDIIPELTQSPLMRVFGYGSQ